MKILLVNDDGYYAKGIKSLAKIMSRFGEVTVIAPKQHQSGMANSINLTSKPKGYRHLGKDEDGVDWAYFDATPTCCVKYALNYLHLEFDVVVSGINHGSNACAASLYSGTLGACMEATVNGVPAIGVSLDNMNHEDIDFTIVEKHFPAIFQTLYENIILDMKASQSSRSRCIYYNVNFPDIPADELKGVKVGYKGRGRWINEYDPYEGPADPDIEEGETAVVIGGYYEEDSYNDSLADHIIMQDGYAAVTALTIETTAFEEVERLKTLF